MWSSCAQMVLLMDPHVVIAQAHGKYPQPMAELEVRCRIIGGWSGRWM